MDYASKEFIGHCICCGLPCKKSDIFEPCCQWCSSGFYNELTGTCEVCKSADGMFSTQQTLWEIKKKARSCPVVFLKNKKAAARILHSAMSYSVIPTVKNFYVQHDNMGKFSLLFNQDGFGVICPGYMSNWSMRRIQRQMWEDFQLNVSAGKDVYQYSDV
jgi:hypothetical protein